MADYDSPWKEALDEFFEPFVSMLFPAAHAGIDWSRGYESLDKELQQVAADAEPGRMVVDKLVKVWRTSGEEEWVLIHVEVQRKPESGFGRRIYTYNCRIFVRHEHSVASFAVLADERPGWRPNHFGYNLWGSSVDFRFPTVKLLDLAADWDALERSDNPFAPVVMAHLKAMEFGEEDDRRRIWKLRLAKGLYRQGRDREYVRRMFRIIDWFLRLPPPVEREVWQELEAFEQEMQMPYVTSVERIGIEKGLEQGREQGRLEGLEQALELLLASKFGDGGRALMPEIRRTHSAALVQSLIERIQTVGSPDDVRTILASEPPRG